MGLTRKEAGAETYKTRIDYIDAEDKTAYEDMASLLKGTEAAETAAVESWADTVEALGGTA